MFIINYVNKSLPTKHKSLHNIASKNTTPSIPPQTNPELPSLFFTMKIIVNERKDQMSDNIVDGATTFDNDGKLSLSAAMWIEGVDDSASTRERLPKILPLPFNVPTVKLCVNHYTKIYQWSVNH